MPSPEDSHKNPPHVAADSLGSEQEETIDLRALFEKLRRGLPQILGLSLLGIAIGAFVYLLWSRDLPVSSSVRIAFSFPSAGKGTYPDGSKFAASDILAPDVVLAAQKSVQWSNSVFSSSQLRTALSVEPIIPQDVTRVHDKLIAAGQVAPVYVPDEYSLVFTQPRKVAIGNRERVAILEAILEAFRLKFVRTYASVPAAFGNLQQTLANSDFDDFERILSTEMNSIDAYLKQLASEAPTFRSPTTNNSFNDLLKEERMFDQIYLDETLGLIRISSLSRDRPKAILKMEYQMATLSEQEQRAQAEDATTRELLARAESRNSNYVLAVKSQAAANAPVMDQGLVDSILANDTYSFLMRKALESSIKVKDLQSEEAQVSERKKKMLEAMNGKSSDADKDIIRKTEESIKTLNAEYGNLINNVRSTYDDYSAQEFADALRQSSGITTDSMVTPLLKSVLIGLAIGAAAGMGLSLLEVYIGGKRRGAVSA
jgi:hypothetical protein